MKWDFSVCKKVKSKIVASTTLYFIPLGFVPYELDVFLATMHRTSFIIFSLCTAFISNL